MNRKIGYGRVSTNDQDLKLQIDALVKDGCGPSLIFTDKISGAKSSQPGLDECLEILTNAGLAAARARGKNGGRPRVGINNPKVIMAKQMHQNKTVPIDSICESLAISRATFYRYLAM